MISKRALELNESQTLALMSVAEEMRRKGVNVISFAVGEPDFPTDRRIVNAAHRAMKEGKTHYVPAAGIPELREAIAEHYRKMGADLSADRVIITPAKLGLQLAVLTLVDPGYEVLIPDPGWVSYEPMVKMAGGVPVRYSLREENGFAPDVDELKKLISERTSAIIINSPSNPTGAVFDRDTLEGICDLARDVGITVISDEVYDRIVYDVPHISIATLLPDRAVVIGSFSKSFAMTGWRIGYTIAPADLYPHMLKFQQHTISCASSISQYAALYAIQHPEIADGMMKEFRVRRKLMYELMEEIDWIEPNMPEGTFYMWVRHTLGRPSAEVSDILLRKHGVVVTPGSAFGPMGEGYLRFSFATSRENITEGLQRISSPGL